MLLVAVLFVGFITSVHEIMDQDPDVVCSRVEDPYDIAFCQAFYTNLVDIPVSSKYSTRLQINYLEYQFQLRKDRKDLTCFSSGTNNHTHHTWWPFVVLVIFGVFRVRK